MYNDYKKSERKYLMFGPSLCTISPAAVQLTFFLRVAQFRRNIRNTHRCKNAKDAHNNTQIDVKHEKNRSTIGYVPNETMCDRLPGKSRAVTCRKLENKSAKCTWTPTPVFIIIRSVVLMCRLYLEPCECCVCRTPLHNVHSPAECSFPGAYLYTRHSGAVDTRFVRMRFSAFSFFIGF